MREKLPILLKRLPRNSPLLSLRTQSFRFQSTSSSSFAMPIVQQESLNVANNGPVKTTTASYATSPYYNQGTKKHAYYTAHVWIMADMIYCFIQVLHWPKKHVLSLVSVVILLLVLKILSSKKLVPWINCVPRLLIWKNTLSWLNCVIPTLVCSISLSVTISR